MRPSQMGIQSFVGGVYIDLCYCYITGQGSHWTPSIHVKLGMLNEDASKTVFRLWQFDVL